MEKILPLVGVIIGWFLNVLNSFFTENREARKNLKKTVLRCRDRLKAIKEASNSGIEKTFKNEKHHLGDEKNEYLNAMAAYKFEIEERLDISGQLQKILISENLDDIDNLIKDLETMLK